MKESKFRGLANKKWVYGYGLLNNYLIGDCDGSVTDLITITEGTGGQYIGLRDIYFTEIYEGDIVKVKWNDGTMDHTTIGEVLFNNGSRREVDGQRPTPCCFMVEDHKRHDFLFHWHMTFEVIGNIHENPELMDDHIQ